MESWYKNVDKCPWCNSQNRKNIHDMHEGGNVVKCDACGIVYATKILNQYGLQEYWKDYESKVHIVDTELAEKRMKMYEFDYDFIRPFLPKGASVLDVGCSNGDFLDFFHQDGYQCEGIEYGEEAWRIVSKKYKCHCGDLSNFKTDKKYDVIVFRGVIQYLLNPKADLERAINLLNEGGLLYITATPNCESLCFNLFKDKFTVPVTPADYYMFSEPVLTDFMKDNGMALCASGNLYLGTPYENYEEDILKIANALQEKTSGKSISGKCPAFWDNMLTLLYKK